MRFYSLAMRAINNIVIHCTATPQTASISNIRRYWRDVLGWKSPGYHRIVEADGTMVVIAPDSAICNGVAGHNANSLHISYVGGIDGLDRPKDTRTNAQRATLERQVKEWKRLYPNARILGHRDFHGVKKACPSFDVAAWLKEIGL